MNGTDVIIGCSFVDNGQLGVILSNSTGGVFLDNEVARNNYAGVSENFAGGGFKFSKTTDFTIRNNCIFENEGHALWLDGDNVRTIIEGNMVWDNQNDGIKFEISYDGEIRGNISGGNGFENGNDGNGLGGCQIVTQNSSGTVTEDNVVEVPSAGGNGICWVNDSGRGSGILGPYKIRDCQQLNNDITFIGTAGYSGAWAAASEEAGMTGDPLNVINNNTYTVSDATDTHYRWTTQNTFTQFQTAGREANGSEAVSAESATTFACNG